MGPFHDGDGLEIRILGCTGRPLTWIDRQSLEDPWGEEYSSTLRVTHKLITFH